jgi:hypothetical protein
MADKLRPRIQREELASAPPMPTSEVKFSDDESFEKTVAGIHTPSVTTETPKGSGLAERLVMSTSTSPPASAVDAWM